MANLAQLKRLEELDGMLLVDKPEGIAFASVVKAVKRRFNLVKVGHGGSLDAMASGLFVLLVNDANRFVDQIMGADREYVGTLTLGLATNTGDIHGTELQRTVPSVRRERFKSALKELKGDIFQTEPRFAAIRREGTADYEVVETGDHPQTLAHVYRFRFAESALAGDAVAQTQLDFELKATKGLLPRSLVDDFGKALGCGATLTKLRRMKIGPLDVADAVPFDRILTTDLADFASLVKPIGQALR